MLKVLSFYIFQFGQRFGLNILPNHYYIPIADISQLRRTRSDWARPSALSGVEAGIEAQVEALRTIVAPFEPEYHSNSAFHEAVQGKFGPGYGPIEAQALHGFIRHFQPPRVVEVGSGVSTHCMLKAAELNDRPTQITCIEPYPKPYLRSTNVNLHEKLVQSMEPGFFDQLEAGDMLFIDSSHTVRPGGDVQYLYLEVLPRLNSGVHVHIHDIFLPYSYNRNVLKSYMHWTETALLQALMVNNSKLAITFCLSMLHYEAQSVLKEVFPSYNPQPDQDGLLPDSTSPFHRNEAHFPSSIYLVTKES